MADSVSEPTHSANNNRDKKITLTEMLDKWCIFYMSVGVSYDEFWYGDYTRLKYYFQAYKKRLEQENFGYWLQGLYFNNALMVNLSNFGSSSSRQKKYSDTPIRLFPMTEEEMEAERNRNIQKTISTLNKLAQNSKTRDK